MEAGARKPMRGRLVAACGSDTSGTMRTATGTSTMRTVMNVVPWTDPKYPQTRWRRRKTLNGQSFPSVRRTPALTGRGERMRASGPVERVVRRRVALSMRLSPDRTSPPSGLRGRGGSVIRSCDLLAGAPTLAS